MKLNRTNKKIISLIFSILIMTSVFAGIFVTMEASALVGSHGDFKEEILSLQDLNLNIDNLLEKEMKVNPDGYIPVIIMLKERPNVKELYVEALKVSTAKSQKALATYLRQVHADNVVQHWIINAISAEVKADQIDNIAQRADVEKVWLDSKVYLIEPAASPSWTAEDYGDGLISADNMWAKGLNGTGINISILDTGIKASHPDLGARVILERDFTDSASGTLDINGHGTHVAGIAAGARNTTSNISGVAYNASIFNAKVLNDTGVGYNSWIIAGIGWSVNNHADVICMSLGIWQEAGDGSDPLSLAVTNAVTRYGVVAVVAAGNKGLGEATIGNPAVARGTIAVAASDNADEIADFSSRGPTGDGRVGVDIAAPGVNIRAPRAQWKDGRGLYVNLDGTSMATPHVAGAAALLLQMNPTLTPTEIERVLKNSADDLGTDVLEQGAGRLDIYDAYSSLKTGILVNDEWSVGRIFPGSMKNKIFTVINNNATAEVTLNIVETIITDTQGGDAGNWLTIIPTSITVPTNAIKNFDATISVPYTAVGTYIGNIRLTSDELTTDIRIPISVNVIQKIEIDAVETITGTVDEKKKDQILFSGDWIYYTLDIQPGVAVLNLSLDWVDTSNDLDLYLFNPMNKLEVYSAQLAKPETIFIAAPNHGNWMVAINAYTLITTPETYTLTITIIHLKGDINGDERLTMADPIFLWNHIRGISGFEVIHANGDINGDGRLTMADPIFLWNHIRGISGFEVIH